MKPSIIRRTIFFITILILSACGSIQSPRIEPMEATKCPELRPEMCTMDYNPVCGNLSEGSSKTYSTPVNPEPSCDARRIL